VALLGKAGGRTAPFDTLQGWDRNESLNLLLLDLQRTLGLTISWKAERRWNEVTTTKKDRHLGGRWLKMASLFRGKNIGWHH